MTQFQSLLFAQGPRDTKTAPDNSTYRSGSFETSDLLDDASNQKVKSATKFKLNVTFHDAKVSEVPVLVDRTAVAGTKEGDFYMLYKTDDRNKKKKRVIFQLKSMDQQYMKRLNNKFSISVLNTAIPYYLGVQKSNVTTIKRVANPSSYHTQLIEIYVKDIYLSRGDMWVLSNHIINNFQYCHVNQAITIFNSIALVVSKIYIGSNSVFSGIITKKTKIVFRSKSSKLTFLIQLSSDMFHFDDNGEIMYNKIINSLFPTIFQHWLDMGTNHLITVILFTSILKNDDEQLRTCRVGEAYTNAKDYYRIVVDQININHWAKIMINLRYEILRFKEDIGLIDSQLLPSTKGNLLQALNFSTILMLNNVNNLTSLRHTQNHFIMVSPGSGINDIEFNVFNKIVRKILKLDVSVDLVCLGTIPYHYTPMFRYRDPMNTDNVVYRFPTWFNCYFWFNNKFYNTFNSPDSIVGMVNESVGTYNKLRCKIYQLQMMGIMEYLSSGLTIPCLGSTIENELGQSIKTIREYMEEYDKQRFKIEMNTAQKSKSLDDWFLSRVGRLPGAVMSQRLSDLKPKTKDSLKTLSNKHKAKAKLSAREELDFLLKQEKLHKIQEKPAPSSTQKSLFIKPDDSGDQDSSQARRFKIASTSDNSEFKTTPSAGLLPSVIEGIHEKSRESAYTNLKETQKGLTPEFKARGDDSASLRSLNSDILSRSHLYSSDDLSLTRRATNTSAVTATASLLSPGTLKHTSSTSRLSSKGNSGVSSAGKGTGTVSGTLNTTAGTGIIVGNKNDSQNIRNFSLSSITGSTASQPFALKKLFDIFGSFTKQPESLPSVDSSERKLRNVQKSKSRHYRSTASFMLDAASPADTAARLHRHMSSATSSSASTRNSAKRFPENSAKSLRYNKKLSKRFGGSGRSLDDDSVQKLDSKLRGKDRLEHLGILFEHPFVFESNLDFSKINFGKWKNVYPDASTIRDNATKSGNDTSVANTPSTSTTGETDKSRNMISWKSLICPASLPSITEEFPHAVDSTVNYQTTIYEIYPNQHFSGIVDVRDLLKEMVYVRLMMGFQICNDGNKDAVSKFELKESGKVQNGFELVQDYFPKGFEKNKIGTFQPIIYMTILDELHRILLDSERILVRIFKKSKNLEESETLDGYKLYIRTRYDTLYKEIELDDSIYSAGEHNWNKIDYYLAGNFDEKHSEFSYDAHDAVNVYQIRLVVFKNQESKASEFEEESRCSHLENLKNLIKAIQRDEFKEIHDMNVFGDNESLLNENDGMTSILLDIDQAKISHKAEIIKIYYDNIDSGRHMNTKYSFDDNCFHIKLQWLTTTPKLIDDLITKWSHACERYNLNLVEVPANEVYKTPKLNPFHSYIDIKLVYDPWQFQEEYFKPFKGLNKYYYHNYLLKKCNYVLDDGNEVFLHNDSDLSDSTTSKNLGQKFSYVQYVHETGVYLAQVLPSGDFFLVPNNIYIAKINLRKQVGLNSSKYLKRKYLGFYKNEKEYMSDYVNRMGRGNNDDDSDYFFDSQSIMISFLEKCKNAEFLQKVFQEAKDELAKNHRGSKTPVEYSYLAEESGSILSGQSSTQNVN